MTEPTDAEIIALLGDRQFSSIGAVREALRRWGTPPAVAPWRSAVLDLIDDCPGLTLEQDRWLSRRVKELDFASTPQPTQAQAGAVPLTWCGHCGEGVTTFCRGKCDDRACPKGLPSIKGGQHGAE